VARAISRNDDGVRVCFTARAKVAERDKLAQPRAARGPLAESGRALIVDAHDHCDCYYDDCYHDGCCEFKRNKPAHCFLLLPVFDLVDSRKYSHLFRVRRYREPPLIRWCALGLHKKVFIKKSSILNVLITETSAFVN